MTWHDITFATQSTVTNCLTEIKSWMKANFLQLNCEKKTWSSSNLNPSPKPITSSASPSTTPCGLPLHILATLSQFWEQSLLPTTCQSDQSCLLPPEKDYLSQPITLLLCQGNSGPCLHFIQNWLLQQYSIWHIVQSPKQTPICPELFCTPAHLLWLLRNKYNFPPTCGNPGKGRLTGNPVLLQTKRLDKPVFCPVLVLSVTLKKTKWSRCLSISGTNNHTIWKP